MNMKAPIRRNLTWLGDTKKKIRSFPDNVKKLVGDELQFIQFGEIPKDTKPFKGVGGGTFEIVTPFDTNTYRTVVAVKIGKNIYVLHAFMKKSKKGIATPKQDVALIKQRLLEAKGIEKLKGKEND